MRRTTYIFERVDQVNGEIDSVFWTAVCQRTFGNTPNTFVRIELRRIRGEAFKPQPTEVSATKQANWFSAMDFGVVPENDQPAAQMSQQPSDKTASVKLLNVFAMELVIESNSPSRWTDRDARDD